MNPEAVLRDMTAQEQRFVIGIDYGTTYTGMHCVFINIRLVKQISDRI
jgi:hypothetical protein